MPSERTYCAVHGCGEKKNANLPFFSLPRDEERRNKWLHHIGRPDLINPNTKPEGHYVCALHFEKSMINHRPLLKSDSMPTRLLPAQLSEPISSGSNNTNTFEKMSPRWGIVSAGKISHDFVTAIHSAPAAVGAGPVNIAAVAARDAGRARQFAQKHGIKQVFNSYEEMAKSKDIDVAYIGALNHSHYELSKLFLENGKHVLCEKPLCLNEKQVRSLVELARQKRCFLMEAVWSRSLPSYDALEKELQSGKLGDILYVDANFGDPGDGKGERVAPKEVGGGTMLDIGIYVLQFAQFVFKDTPIKVTASGTLNKDGVDEAASVILEYTGGRLAVLSVHTRVPFDNFATVVGTKGSVKLLHPFHCSERLQNVDGSIDNYPLHKGAFPYNFVNSGGLAYQAFEVNKCIEKGLIESPRMSHTESLLLAKLEDTIRSQLGVHYDADDQNY